MDLNFYKINRDVGLNGVTYKLYKEDEILKTEKFTIRGPIFLTREVKLLDINGEQIGSLIQKPSFLARRFEVKKSGQKIGDIKVKFFGVGLDVEVKTSEKTYIVSKKSLGNTIEFKDEEGEVLARIEKRDRGAKSSILELKDDTEKLMVFSVNIAIDWSRG